MQLGKSVDNLISLVVLVLMRPQLAALTERNGALVASVRFLACVRVLMFF